MQHGPCREQPVERSRGGEIRIWSDHWELCGMLVVCSVRRVQDFIYFPPAQTGLSSPLCSSSQSRRRSCLGMEAGKAVEVLPARGQPLRFSSFSRALRMERAGLKFQSAGQGCPSDMPQSMNHMLTFSSQWLGEATRPSKHGGGGPGRPGPTRSPV